MPRRARGKPNRGRTKTSRKCTSCSRKSSSRNTTKQTPRQRCEPTSKKRRKETSPPRSRKAWKRSRGRLPPPTAPRPHRRGRLKSHHNRRLIPGETSFVLSSLFETEMRNFHRSEFIGAHSYYSSGLPPSHN